MSGKSMGKNSIYSVIKSCSTVVFPLITFPYISRVLKPEYVGRYNFAYTIITYFAMFASLGITTYAVRECAKYKRDIKLLNKTASQIFSINLISTIVAYIFLVISILFVPKFSGYCDLLIIMSISIIFTTLGADWINTAMEDFKYITMRTMFFQVLSLALMFIFVRKPEDYMAYAIISLIASGGGSVVNIIYRRKYCKIHFTLNMDVKKHLLPIISLFAMIVAQQVFTASDTTMIGFFYSDYEVGMYTTALKIYNIVNQLITSITWVVMPQLSIGFSNENYEEIRKIIKYVIQFTGVLGLPCIIGIFIMHSEIIILIAGIEYLNAASVLRVFSITLLASFCGNLVLNNIILASGKDKVALMGCVVPAILNLMLNLVFIPSYGIISAAWTTVLSQFVVVLICIPFIERECSVIKLMSHLWKPCVAGAILAVSCLFVKLIIHEPVISLIICIILGGGVYFLTLLLIKEEFVLNILNKLLKRRK